jgi:hypothetical protein
MSVQLRKLDERRRKTPIAIIAPRSTLTKGGAMEKTFTCERDGTVIRGATDDELVANVERHVRDAHPDLVGKLSRVDILATATEA